MSHVLGRLQRGGAVNAAAPDGQGLPFWKEDADSAVSVMFPVVIIPIAVVVAMTLVISASAVTVVVMVAGTADECHGYGNDDKFLHTPLL